MPTPGVPRVLRYVSIPSYRKMSALNECIPADPTTCPPGPSLPTPAQDLNIQIITTLCPSKCFGLQFATLLSRLQQNFPATAWDEATLTTILNSGKRQGIYTGGCARLLFQVRWAVNREMAYLHPTNRVYQNICKFIRFNPSCNDTQAGNYNAVYSGNEPCCFS